MRWAIKCSSVHWTNIHEEFVFLGDFSRSSSGPVLSELRLCAVVMCEKSADWWRMGSVRLVNISCISLAYESPWYAVSFRLAWEITPVSYCYPSDLTSNKICIFQAPVTAGRSYCAPMSVLNSTPIRHSCKRRVKLAIFPTVERCCGLKLSG